MVSIVCAKLDKVITNQFLKEATTVDREAAKLQISIPDTVGLFLSRGSETLLNNRLSSKSSQVEVTGS